MTRQTITTPIALSRRSSAVITLPWFVQRVEYAPQPCTFHPLVNGEEAFGDLHDTIAAAQKSVDIICWGFQPSMFFKRGARERGTPCIGDLLEAAGKRGVKVRLLSWGGEVFGIPGMTEMGDEPNLPDRMHQHPWFSRPPNPRVNPTDFNRYWHWRAARTSPTAKILKGPVPSQIMPKPARSWARSCRRTTRKPCCRQSAYRRSPTRRCEMRFPAGWTGQNPARQIRH